MFGGNPSLKVRVTTLLTIAFLPVAAATGIVGWKSYDNLILAQQADLRSSVEDLNQRVKHINQSVGATLGTMATGERIATGEGVECSRRLEEIRRFQAGVDALMIFDGSRLACGAAAASLQPTFAGVAHDVGLAEMSRRMRPFQDVREGVDGRSYMLFATPINPSIAADRWAVSLVSNAWLADELRPTETLHPIAAGLILAKRLFLSTRPDALLVGPWRPDVERESAVNQPPKIYQVGDRYVVTMATTIPDLQLVSTMSSEAVQSYALRQLVPILIMPILTLAAVLIAIWYALDNVIIARLRMLAETAAELARHESTRRIGPLRDAPLEVKQVAATLDLLADENAARERALRQEVAQKQAHLRELHHRIKNIFQVISSLFNLHDASTAANPMLTGILLEARVSALASAFRSSYASSDIGLVSLEAVIGETCTRLRPKRLHIQASFSRPVDQMEIVISLDTAIPVAGLLTELLLSYISHDPSARPMLTITIAQLGERVEVRVSAAPKGADGGEPSGMGRRLADAFLAQLDGVGISEGSVIGFAFNLRPVTYQNHPV